MKPSHCILALLINAAWGFNIVAVKIGLQHFTPVFFTFLRFALLAILMLPWLKIAKGQMWRITAIALTSGVLHFTTFFGGVYFAENSASVAVLLQLSVPFATLLAVIFLHERISLWQTTGILIALGGAMLISFEPLVFNYMNAVILTIIAALAYATGAVISRTLKNVGALQIQAWLALISIPSLAALSWLLEQNQLSQLQHIDFTSTGALIYTVLGASILGHGGMYYLLKHYPVTVVTPFMLLSPVVGVLAAVTLLDNEFTLRMLTGSIIIIVGIGMITLKMQQHKNPDHPRQ